MVTKQTDNRELARTCWRDMSIGHPDDWELFRVMWEQQRWRCSFVDRYNQRMDMRWRTLDYVPDLDRMLERHQEKEQLARTSRLTGLPDGWKGTRRKVEGGSIVNAGAFFENTKQFVELILVWPGRRDAALERCILEAIRPNLPEGGRRLWKAMGIELLIDENYDVLDYKAEAGKLLWKMGSDRKSPPDIEVERLAMPKYWLKEPLADWLANQASGKVRDVRSDFVNGHEAAVVLSSSTAGPLDMLMLRRCRRIDVAWLCPDRQKVYRVAHFKPARSGDIALPRHLKMVCCRNI